MVEFDRQKWLEAIEQEIIETTTNDGMEDEVQTLIDMMEVIGALKQAVHSIQRDITLAYQKAVQAEAQ